LAWITDELLVYTQNVWSKAYGKPVAEDDAIEILVNTKRFADVLLKAANDPAVQDIDRETVNRDAEERMSEESAREPWERVCNRKEKARLERMYGPEPRRRKRSGQETPPQDGPPATSAPPP
jgi:hypothetical protein